MPLISKDTQGAITLGINKRYRLTLIMDKDDNIVGEVAIDLGEWADDGTTNPDVLPDLDMQVNPTGITEGVTYTAATRTFDVPFGVSSFQFEMLNDASLSITTDGAVVTTVKAVEIPISRGVNAITYEVTFGTSGEGHFAFTTEKGTQHRFEIKFTGDDPSKYPGTNLDPIEVDNLLWAPVNVGATSINDPGKLFQYGRLNGWADGATVVTATSYNYIYIAAADTPGNAEKFVTVESTVSYWWPNDETVENINALMARWRAVSDGSNNPCPTGWRLPTKVEAEALLTGQTPTVEVVSAEVSKLTVQGVSFISKEYIYGSAGATLRTSESVYWLAPSGYEDPDVIKCTKTAMAVSEILKTSHACSIRCVKDKPVAP